MKYASTTVGQDVAHGHIGVEFGKLRGIHLADLAIRFAFGFGVSVFAGLVTIVGGNHVGGLFLAFPAILPASLTLISAREGRRKAETDASGAILGSIALIAFALTSVALILHLRVAVAETIALAVWVVVATALYVLLRQLLRRNIAVTT